MNPSVLSPVTNAQDQHHNLLTGSEPNQVICAASQSNITKSMNWNFHHPIIVQGTSQPECLQYISQLESKIYDIDVVAGISGGYESVIKGEIPIFDLVENAIQKVDNIKTSVIFTPSNEVLDASLEAIAFGIKQLVIVTSDVPPLDTIELAKVAIANKVVILGPGSAGIIIPNKYSIGTLQSQYFRPGNVSIIGYSPTLIYEVAWALNQVGMGQSLGVSLGQDKLICSDPIQWLQMLDEDECTDIIVLIQNAQDIDSQALQLLPELISKPVICYVVGSQTPQDKVFRQGVDILHNHLSNSILATHSYRKMLSNIKKSGAILASNPSEITQLVKQILSVSSD